MRSHRLALALGLALAPACSFAFVDGPPRQHREMPFFECTESRLVPALDTVWTAVQVVRIAVALTADDSAFEQAPLSRNVEIGLGATFGVLGAGGMIYGFSRTARCRAARAEQRQRWQQGAVVPAPTTWPPPAPMPPPEPPPAPPPGPEPPGPPEPAPDA